MVFAYLIFVAKHQWQKFIEGGNFQISGMRTDVENNRKIFEIRGTNN